MADSSLPKRTAVGSKICRCCGLVKDRSRFYREPYVTPQGAVISRCTRTCQQCVDALDVLLASDASRQCSECQEVKSLQHFSIGKHITKSGAVTASFRRECKVCEVTKKRNHRHANPQYYREKGRIQVAKRTPEQKFKWMLSGQYGLTVEQYQAMIEAQNGVCAICREVPRHRSRTEGRFLVDHCHTTGKVRGLLCHNCNVSIGLLKEDPVRIRALLAYVERCVLHE